MHTAEKYGGGYSDDCTATRNMVMKGYTAMTADSNDEIVPGELELTGDAAEAHVLSGKTFYSTDPRTKRTGKIPIQAGETFLPDTTDKVAVKGGTYVSTNLLVPKFTLPAANVIKKGVKVTMYGKSVTGTFEGWVPGDQDLYLNGNNKSGWKAAAGNDGEVTFTNDHIYMVSNAGGKTVIYVDSFTRPGGKTKLNVQLSVMDAQQFSGGGYFVKLSLASTKDISTTGPTLLASQTIDISGLTWSGTLSIDISKFGTLTPFSLVMDEDRRANKLRHKFKIYRIWVS